MEEIRVSGFEINYTRGDMRYYTDFSKGKVKISEDGSISTTFERDIQYSDEYDYGYGYDYDLPIVEVCEYKISPWEIQRIFFNRYDLLSLAPAKDDILVEGIGEWNITIFTEKGDINLKGYKYPEPYGKEFFNGLKRLIKYKIVPDLP